MVMDRVLSLKVGREMLNRLRAVATARGVSVSEVVRRAVRREFDKEESAG